nr:hypothetical protein [uncultured Blautia sp.]
MKTNQKLHQLHLNEWAQRFVDQKASGLTVKQWCEDNNFTIYAYNYWKRVFKEEVGNQVLPDIVPIVLPEAECKTLPVSQVQQSYPHPAFSPNTTSHNAIRANCATAVLTMHN